MREIKFRAWHKKAKCFIGFFSNGLTMSESGQIYCGNMNVTSGIELMQFIGVRDKNGKEIYEGDIIQTYFSFDPGDAGYGVSQKPFVVDWNQEHASFRAKKPEAEAGSLHLLDIISFFSMQSRLYEVIGNIHENPELLKAKV